MFNFSIPKYILISRNATFEEFYKKIQRCLNYYLYSVIKDKYENYYLYKFLF